MNNNSNNKVLSSEIALPYIPFHIKKPRISMTSCHLSWRNVFLTYDRDQGL